MTRFFFDIHDGSEVRDQIGRELASTALVRTEALRVITKLIAAEAEDGKETTLVLTVRDGAGSTPLKVRLICQVEEFELPVLLSTQGSTSREEYEGESCHPGQDAPLLPR